MTPIHFIFAVLALATFFLFRSARPRLEAALSETVLKLLDAVAYGYLYYLIVAFVFDFSAFSSWSGVMRVLFFTGQLKGGEYLGILCGVVIAFYRLANVAGSASKPPAQDYQGGERLLCHKTALRISNAMLASRTANAKAKVSLPQHLTPDVDYTFPAETELDAVEALEDLDTNRALLPYVSETPEFQTVQWGMMRLPYAETENHFLIVGASGSGKTILIRQLMKSVLPKVEHNKNFRAFVYDNKPDFLPFAKLLKLEKYIWNLDPFDINGAAWDIAAEVTSHAAAKQIATVLVPVDTGLKEPFFQQAVHNLVEAVLIRLREVAGGKWTLRDLILAFDKQPRLERLIKNSPQSERLADAFLKANRSFDDVRASIRAKLRPYDIVASLWSKATVARSVTEWAKTNAILMVTHRDEFEEAIKPINQTIFRMVSTTLLTQNDSEERESWIFLDEIREIGKLQGYHALANKGRSKGARLVLGFQSLSGMRAEYQDIHAADEVADVVGNKTFLHIDCVVTREWAARHVGTCVVNETVFSHGRTFSKEGISTSVNSQTTRVARQAIEPTDFQKNLKKLTPENGLTALNMVPALGTYVSWLPFSWIEKNCERPKQVDQEKNTRPASDQEIQDWGPADLKRLNLPEDFLVDPAPAKLEPEKDGKKGGKGGGNRKRSKGDGPDLPSRGGPSLRP